MAKKMKIKISFEDENGKMVTKPIEITKDVPWIKEFDKHGFDKGFDEFETAVLEGRQEACEKAAEEYFKNMSKKNSKNYPLKEKNTK